MSWPRPLPQAALSWITSDDTGISSKTIWSVMAGTAEPGVLGYDYGIPHDADDFGRCYRLLEAVPEWRPLLYVVGIYFPAWRPLVAAWPELDALYRKAYPTWRRGEGLEPERGQFWELIQDLDWKCHLAEGWTGTRNSCRLEPAAWKATRDKAFLAVAGFLAGQQKEGV